MLTMTNPKPVKRREPKPCPRCYAPMRLTTTGYECERHGAPPPDRSGPIRAHAERTASNHRHSPRISRPRMAKPRPVSSQTQQLNAMRETILSRNQAGESIAAIARDLWQELGYASWHVAASKISAFLKLRGLDVAPTKSGPHPGAQPKTRFTEERLVEVRAALGVGETVWSFADSHWEAWGFTSRSACDSLIRKWLRTRSA